MRRAIGTIASAATKKSTGGGTCAASSATAIGMKARSQLIDGLTIDLMPSSPPCRQYALSPAARNTATARSVAVVTRVRAPDRGFVPFAPGVESVDHRILGTWSAHGAEAVLQHLRSLHALSHDYGARSDDVLALRSDAFLVRLQPDGAA